MRAFWQGVTLAESDAVVDFHGTPYFPPDAMVVKHFTRSGETSICPWRGTAHYFDLQVGEQTLSKGAWSYPDPKPGAEQIKGHVAFADVVEILE